MKVFILNLSGRGSLKLDPLNPWQNLLSEWRVEKVEDPGKADYFLVNNLNHRSAAFSKKFCTPLNSALILWESAVTSPMNVNLNLHSNFRLVMSPSQKWVPSAKLAVFNWPQNNPSDFKATEYSKNYFSRKDKWVMVQSKKFSFALNEMYSLRNALIALVPEDIELWGFGWEKRSYSPIIRAFARNRPSKVLQLADAIKFNQKIPENFQGLALDKIETMSNYKYSIIIENSPDYVSEKLIDAIIAGTAPIYVGPCLEEFGIPGEVALISAPSVEELKINMNLISSDTNLRTQILENGRKFLESDKFKSRINVNVFSELGRTLKTEF